MHYCCFSIFPIIHILVRSLVHPIIPYVFVHPLFSSSISSALRLWVHLVLALSSNEKVIEYVLYVVKGGPVLWPILPALQHNVIKLLWTSIWTRHPVIPVKVSDHLWIRHAWNCEESPARFLMIYPSILHCSEWKTKPKREKPITWIWYSAVRDNLCQKNSKGPHVWLDGESTKVDGLRGRPFYRELCAWLMWCDDRR